MKKLYPLLAAFVFCISAFAQSPVSFYSYNCPNLAGDTINMGIYAGKKLMIVNVACYCLYTPEFTPLEELDSAYSKYNFEVIGFPSNDFLHEGGNDSEIIATCHSYDVNFPIMATVSIVTGDTAPIYKWLQCKSLNGVSNATVSWNFNKFLIDRQGNWVQWYDSPVSPLDTAITNWIIEDSASLSGIAPVSGDMISLQSANPASTSIDLKVVANSAGPVTIDLYNMDGSLAGAVYAGDISNGQVISYPVGNLASGIYLLQARAVGWQKVFKCAVQH